MDQLAFSHHQDLPLTRQNSVWFVRNNNWKISCQNGTKTKKSFRESSVLGSQSLQQAKKKRKKYNQVNPVTNKSKKEAKQATQRSMMARAKKAV